MEYIAFFLELVKQFGPTTGFIVAVMIGIVKGVRAVWRLVSPYLCEWCEQQIGLVKDMRVGLVENKESLHGHIVESRDAHGHTHKELAQIRAVLPLKDAPAGPANAG